MQQPALERGPKRFKIDKGVVLACLVVAVGAVFVLRGLMVSVTGDARNHYPDAVERVAPVPEAVQALSQTSVYADLATGFTGEFTIDGVHIDTVAIDDVAIANPEAGQQVQLPPVTIYEPGNDTLTFTPAAGAPIESFASGQHNVVLTFWPIEQGRARSRTYTWTFNVI